MVVVLLLATTPLGCAGNNLASNLATTPAVPQDRNATCRVLANRSEPLIVEWPETSRGKLEALRRRGLVVVRYEGCEIQVLPGCGVKTQAAKGSKSATEFDYRYEPFERKEARVTIRSEDELFANLPVGAVALQSKLHAAGQLTIDMKIVGRYESGIRKVLRDQLDGECEKASHIITDFSVGAFKFEAGAEAEVGAGAQVGNIGGRAVSDAHRELLARDGQMEACATSNRHDRAPPDGCGALLQIELTPLNEQSVTCSDGYRWSGSECVTASKKVMMICPIGQHMEDFRCLPDVPALVSATPVSKPPAPSLGAPRYGTTGGLGWGLGLSSIALLAGGAGLTTYSFIRADAISSGSTGQCDALKSACTRDGQSDLSTMKTINIAGGVGLGVGVASGLLWIFWPKIAAAFKPEVKVSPTGAIVGMGFEY